MIHWTWLVAAAGIDGAYHEGYEAGLCDTDPAAEEAA